MTKQEREYLNKYKDVPTDFLERYELLLNDTNFKRAKTTVFEEIDRINKIKWKEISYIIYLEPKPTPRPRLGKSGVFYVSGALNNKKLFQKYVINREDITLITTPTKFYCTSYFPIPKSMHPIEKLVAELGFIYPTSKPDWDNVAKAYCDMVQGILLYDDSLIIEGVSKKRYSSKPRIEITLKYMEDYDSNFNRSKILRKVGN